MGKSIAWTDAAKAHLRAIDQTTALRILYTIARYLGTGEGDIKRLQDIEPPEFRLRVGDYRVRFHDLGGSIEIPVGNAPSRSLSLNRPDRLRTQLDDGRSLLDVDAAATVAKPSGLGHLG